MIVRPEAEADLADAQEWYERQQHGLGAEFLRCVEEVFARLERTPRMYGEVYRGVRRVLTRRFPYAVYYRVEEAEVVVLGVFHTSRNPRQWQSRA